MVSITCQHTLSYRVFSFLLEILVCYDVNISFSSFFLFYFLNSGLLFVVC